MCPVVRVLLFPVRYYLCSFIDVDVSRKDEMGRAGSTSGAKRNAYRILVGKSEGKRPLGRTKRRWVDNIKIDFYRDRMGWYGVDRSGSG
jgi:hypothetical protein